MLYFLTEHILIIYVQYIKGSKRKTSYILEKFFEKGLIVSFVSDSIFKRLKYDYSSSETVSTHKKIKNYLLDGCLFLEIRIIHGNLIYPI